MNPKFFSTFGIMLGAFDSASGSAGGGAADLEVAALERRSADANKALIRGDIDGSHIAARTRFRN